MKLTLIAASERVLLCACFIQAQVRTDIDSRISSLDWNDRKSAFEAIAGPAGHNVGKGKPSSALSQLTVLLAREEEFGRSDKALPETENEMYSEYFSWLAEAVLNLSDSYPDLSDAWPALLHISAASPQSAFTRTVAKHGDKIWALVLAAENGRDPDMSRDNALLLAAQIVSYERQQLTAHHLSREDLAKLGQPIREAVEEGQTFIIRYQAIKALGMIGTADDISLLERIATLDPQFVTDGGQSGKELHYPLRELAQTALNTLRQRLAREQQRR